MCHICPKFNTFPCNAAIEDKVPEIPVKVKEPSKRAATRKKPSVIFSEISEEEISNDSGDDDYEIVDSEAEVAKKKGGRKPSAAAKKSTPPAATKKGQANRQQARGTTQRLLTEMLKPAESTGVSPEKKVRKMRASPFNKKSSSLLGKEGKADSSTSEEMSSNPMSNDGEDVVEVAPPKRRPQRVNRKQTTYVLSDSESEKPTDDSDFEENDD